MFHDVPKVTHLKSRPLVSAAMLNQRRTQNRISARKRAPIKPAIQCKACLTALTGASGFFFFFQLQLSSHKLGGNAKIISHLTKTKLLASAKNCRLLPQFDFWTEWET